MGNGTVLCDEPNLYSADTPRQPTSVDKCELQQTKHTVKIARVGNVCNAHILRETGSFGSTWVL